MAAWYDTPEPLAARMEDHPSAGEDIPYADFYGRDVACDQHFDSVDGAELLRLQIYHTALDNLWRKQ